MSQPVYLDHAATTPIRETAVEAMTGALGLGNPSALHAAGRAARRAVEESRERVAQALGCRPTEVVFTAGGTEADNLAVKGIAWGRREADPTRNRLLTTAVEHPAVLEPAAWLQEHEGFAAELLAVDPAGRLDLEALAARVEAGPETVALLSVMWANNETGTLQPVAEAVAVAAAHGIPVHTDAVQAVGCVPVDFAASGVDALTVSGHKVGGPYGVGALLVRREVPLRAVLHGGGQEREVRSGTVDAPAIVGFAAALEEAVKEQADAAARFAALRDRLVHGVMAVVPDARPHGAGDAVLPGLANLGFPGCEGDALLMLLDAQGIACSTGSACSAGVPQPSPVLLAMGCPAEEASGSLRFSLGHTSTGADVDALVAAIGPAVERARAAGVRR